MMRVAVVDKDGHVVNVIVADENDPPPVGMRLVRIPDGAVVDARFKHRDDIGFYPNAEYALEKQKTFDAEYVSIERAKRVAEMEAFGWRLAIEKQ